MYVTYTCNDTILFRIQLSIHLSSRFRVIRFVNTYMFYYLCSNVSHPPCRCQSRVTRLPLVLAQAPPGSPL